MIYSIHLDDLQFFAHHGLHDEEKITGTRFEVSLQLDFTSDKQIDHLNQTVDYAAVYEIIKKHMQRPEALLERLAANLAGEIQQHHSLITKINIRINKIQPPLSNFTGKVGVSYCKSF